MLSQFYFVICWQRRKRIDTDRPDQTESSYLVPKGFFQGEFGFNIENNKQLKTIVHPTGLWKYGINKRIELRLITELISVETPLLIPEGNTVITGLVPVQIGSKISLWEEKGVLPKTSLIFHVGIPALSSSKFKTPHLAPNFRFTMSHTLSERIGLGYNIGAEWDGFDKTPEWIYTFAPGFNMGKNWYGYVELFGAIKKMNRHNIALMQVQLISSPIMQKLILVQELVLQIQHRIIIFAIGFSFRIDTKK